MSKIHTTEKIAEKIDYFHHNFRLNLAIASEYGDAPPWSSRWGCEPQRDAGKVQAAWRAAISMTKTKGGRCESVPASEVEVPDGRYYQLGLKAGTIQYRDDLASTPRGVRALLHEHGHFADDRFGRLSLFNVRRAEVVADFLACEVASRLGFDFTETVAAYIHYVCDFHPEEFEQFVQRTQDYLGILTDDIFYGIQRELYLLS